MSKINFFSLDTEVKNGNRRSDRKNHNGGSNVWWPWKSYEDWLVSHRRNKDDEELKTSTKQVETTTMSIIKVEHKPKKRKFGDRKNRRQRRKNAKKNSKKNKINLVKAPKGDLDVESNSHSLKSKLTINTFPRKLEIDTENRLPSDILAYSHPETIYKVDSRARKEIQIKDMLNETFSLRTLPKTMNIPEQLLGTSNPLLYSKDKKKIEIATASKSLHSGLRKFDFEKKVSNSTLNDVSPVEDSMQVKVSHYFMKYWKPPLLAIAAKNYTEGRIVILRIIKVFK